MTVTSFAEVLEVRAGRVAMVAHGLDPPAGQPGAGCSRMARTNAGKPVSNAARSSGVIAATHRS